MIKTFLKSVAIAAIACSGTAFAQSNSLTARDVPVSNPSDMVESLDAEAIIPLLSEMGISFDGATLPNGQRILLATAENGIKFQLTPTACDDSNSNCRGLHMLALFQTNAPSRTVSAFNYRYAFVSTGVDDTQVAYISRYEIADYGLPRGNLAVSIANYVHMSTVFDRHLYEATNTVRLDASDTDLAANGLNMQSILADTSLANQIGLSPASHQVSFEALTDVVDTYVRADTLSPGRIVNAVQGNR